MIFQHLAFMALTRGINRNKVSISGRTNLYSFGDSFTNPGLNASPSSLAYINLLKSVYNMTLTNSGASGRGIWLAASSIQGLSFTRTTSLITVLAGFNDLRRLDASSDVRVLKKIEAGYRSIIFKAISSSAIRSGSSSVTRTGTFTAFAANTVGGLGIAGSIPGANTATFNTGGAAATWQWTATGTGFGIQFIANSGDVETYGTCLVKIDGTTVATINLNNWYDNVSDGTYDNRRGPLALTWHGLTNTTHTIQVVANGDGIVPVDFFGDLQTTANSAAMIFGGVPYMDATGYATAPNSGSSATFDLGTTVIKNLVAEYRLLGFPIAFADWNKFYNITTGLSSSDHIHPNNTGHGQGAESFKSVIN